MLHAPHFARDMGVKDIREAAFASSNQAREKMEGTEERGRDDIQTSRRLDEDSEADDLEIIVCKGQGEGAINQVPVKEADIEKTAFRTGTGGLYEYVRMPFGLCNAPGTFMRLMDKAFGDLNFQSLLVYIDDILVFGSTFKETLQRFETVLSRLTELNLKVKPEKCQPFRTKVNYLGHVISNRGTSPNPEKVRAVCEWSRPETLRVLRGFLGLAGYYRRFIKGYAKIAGPLQALLRGHEDTNGKGKNTMWVTEHHERLDEAFRHASENTEKEALRRIAHNDLKADNTDLPLGSRGFLRNRVKGCNKVQDAWDPTPHKAPT